MSPGSVKHSRNGQKTWETHLTVLWFWRKLGGREAVSCRAKWGRYILQQKICGVGRAFRISCLNIPQPPKIRQTLSTFRKGPLQIFTLCGTGDAPNTCPQDILRPPQVMGKEVWDAEDFQVPESQVAWSLVSSPQWCLMGDEHVESSSKERVPEFGMMEEKNLHGPTRRYTNAAWRFSVHVEKLEIHQFNQSIKQSIKFEPGWVITVQDACGHSLNIQLNESTQHSGSHLEKLIEFLSLYILC